MATKAYIIEIELLLTEMDSWHIYGHMLKV
jgi:hypothetical protein